MLLDLLHATETGISSGRVGLWLVCAFTYLCSVKSLQLITFLQLTAVRNLMVTEWCVCSIFSELPPHRGPTTLRLFLWWQIDDRVPHPVGKSHALAWCCSWTEQARGVFVSAQWEWTKAMPRRWWEIRHWSTLERSGVVLRVLPSRNRTRVWC